MNRMKGLCRDCKWIYEAHYEEEGEAQYIKYICKNKYGLSNGYQIKQDDYCSRWETKEVINDG